MWYMFWIHVHGFEFLRLVGSEVMDKDGPFAARGIHGAQFFILPTLRAGWESRLYGVCRRQGALRGAAHSVAS